MADAPTLLINGRWIPEKRLTPAEIVHDNAGFVDGQLAWILLQREELRLLSESDFDSVLIQLSRLRRPLRATGIIARYPWDLVNQNRKQLVRDFVDEEMAQTPSLDQVAILGDPRDVYVSERATIDPFVVLDARTGPISVDRDTHIQSFTRIEGPCHIGRGTKIFRAHIRGGTTIVNIVESVVKSKNQFFTASSTSTTKVFLDTVTSAHGSISGLCRPRLICGTTMEL